MFLLDNGGRMIGDSIVIFEIEPYDNAISLKNKEDNITVSREAADNMFATLYH